jgi:hypothetical protein
MRVLTCFLLWFLLSVLPLSAEIPNVLYIPETESPYPAWVRADEVLTPSGEFNASLFSPGARSIIQGRLQLPPRDGCIWWGQEDEEEGVQVGPDKPARKNLATTARIAGWVFRAKVTARALGFNGSTPGTLLEVLPEETFKGPRDRNGIHYIFFPVGTFWIGETKICKADERYPTLPEIGEHVVLFIDLFWRNESSFLWTGGDSGIVTISAKGRASLPQRYRRTEPWLSDSAEGDLLRFIRTSIEKEP